MKYKILRVFTPFAHLGQTIDEKDLQYFQNMGISIKKMKSCMEPIYDRWMPKTGEYYWFIYGDKDFGRRIWLGRNIDKRYYNFGNCFRTREQVKEAITKVKNSLINYHNKSIKTLQNVQS